MYIQITKKCNMTCDHCCYACGPTGRDMEYDVFLTSCKLAEELEQTIALGGGEPTLHPKFWEFLGLALAYSEDTPFLATNGSQTKTALRLAKLARRGAVSVALSLDVYHDPIEECVEKAFKDGLRTDRWMLGAHDNDFREIRNVTDRVMPGGRASNWYDIEGCVCDDLFIDPIGNIYACGCQKEWFGTVDNPKIPDWYDSGYECKGLIYDEEEEE